MCKTKLLTRTEYDAVRALLAVIAGYEFSYEEVTESRLLSVHYKYAYLITSWGMDVTNAFVDKLTQEERYSLIPLNKIFVKVAN